MSSAPLSSSAPAVVIVGSGMAGYTLLREFRKLDRQTPVTLITADGGESYAKPMLSNALAQGKTAAALIQKTPEQIEAELGVTLLTRHRVESIDRGSGHVVVAKRGGGQQRLAYRDLALALGGDPRPHSLEGSDRVPVHAVNDLEDYAAWREQLKPESRILLIGAGLIGCEFANDLAIVGYKVTIVDPSPWPLGRLLPEAIGAELSAALEAIGVSVLAGRTIARLQPGSARLSDGGTVNFDLVLSAIGLLPRIGLARETGLAVDRGIVVDRMLRTSDPRIFALGDCSQTDAGPLPFVLPLMAQARALAATLAGTPTQLVLQALPVVVKTPCLPLAVCPPPPGVAGTWEIQGEGRDRKALFLDEKSGQAVGFALSGTAAAERQALAKTMPDVLVKSEC